MITFIKQEPVRFASIVVATLIAVIGALRAFGWGVSPAQEGAIVELTRAAVEILIVLAGGQMVRARVSPDPDPPRTHIRRIPPASIVLLALLLTGCGLTAGQVAQGAQNVLGDVQEAAQLLCRASYAEQRRVSVEQAQEQFCTTADQLDPWIDLLTRTKDTAGRALARPE